MTFHTYYWHGHPMGDPELERAREELTEARDVATLSRAFLKLLRSDRAAAIGTALDHYHHAEMSGRHGSGNPFASAADEVLERSRHLLRQPPLPAVTGNGQDGVNHASALGAMVNLAEEDDAELIATVLQNATGESARDTALMAARTALERSSTPNPRLIEVLGTIVFEENNPTSERTAALLALGGSTSTRSAELVVRATAIADLRVQAHAAFVLAYRDLARFRPLLERMVLSWPVDAPYPGSEVLDLLGADDEEADPDETG